MTKSRKRSLWFERLDKQTLPRHEFASDNEEDMLKWDTQRKRCLVCHLDVNSDCMLHKLSDVMGYTTPREKTFSSLDPVKI